jgi:hypothetical protein
VYQYVEVGIFQIFQCHPVSSLLPVNHGREGLHLEGWADYEAIDGLQVDKESEVACSLGNEEVVGVKAF